MKTPDITIHQAMQILDVLGRANDPVFYRRGRPDRPSVWPETTLKALSIGLKTNKANTLYLSYYNATGRQVRGTLAGMVLDRLGCRG